MLAAILLQLVALFAYGNNASSLAIWSVAAVFVLGVLSILTMFLGGITLGIARIKHTNLIRNARAHLCPACTYDLNGRDPSDDHCPECGFAAPKRECVRLWCKLLRSWI